MKSLEQLTREIWAIAQSNPLGFTVSIPNCNFVTQGWAIGHSATQNSFEKKGLAVCIAFAQDYGLAVGGWKGYDGRFYFDAVIIEENGNIALDLKEEHNQLAIYNIGTGQTL